MIYLINKFKKGDFMKKLFLIILLILTIVVITIGYFVYCTDYAVTEVVEPFVKIEKNEELSQANLSLNSENKEIYYYFDLLNYDEMAEQYSKLAITPYVKIGLGEQILDTNETSNDISKYVTVNLYYIKDINSNIEGDNLEEITAKGEAGSEYEEYYQCKKLLKYSKDNEQQNISHYVAKITLNTEDENYYNLTQNLTQKLEIILGYTN